jgi:RND family efflux transporter MFP subunit
MRTFAYILSITSIISLFQACGKKELVNENSKDSSSIPVKVIPIQKQFVQQLIEVSGQFSTDDETFLSFKTGGIINQILVKEGDYVKKGQLLAKLDLTEIAAQVNQALLGFEKAKRDLNRVENLFKDSVATLEQLQNTKTGFEIAKQQLNAAQFNLNYSEIRAVNEGYILKKFVNKGQLIASGMPVFQTNGAGSSDWILKAGISDKEWASVNIGDEAFIKTDALGDKEMKAKVLRKSESADPYTGSFMVELKLEKEFSKKIATGMFGTARIASSNRISNWIIPYQALLDANADKAFVFVTDNEKNANKIEVTIHHIDKDAVQISDGLQNHTYLIVSGNAYLNDNSTIKISK